MPGNNGGSNFGSTSSNPNDGTVYVISYDIPAIMRLLTPQEAAARGGAGWRWRRAAGPGSPCSSATARSAMAPIAAGTPNGVSLVGVAGRLSAEEMRSTVMNGKGRMPPIPHVTPTDLDAVVAYLAAADAPGRGGGRGRGADAAAPPTFLLDQSFESGPAVVRQRTVVAVEHAGQGRRPTRKASTHQRSATR